MLLSKITTSKGGYALSNLVFNESVTAIVGKVQNKHDMTSSISTKWVIDVENEIARCVIDLEDEDDKGIYDISLVNVYVPTVIKPKETKNFYTFKKDAWHCKIYKWVFNKDPFEVHPTMCPYFWIMVLVLLLFPLVIMIRLTGKAGQEFMESTKTFLKRRADEKSRKRTEMYHKKIQEIEEKTYTAEEAYYLLKSNEYTRDYYYNISSSKRLILSDLYQEHRSVLNKIERDKIVKENQELKKLDEIRLKKQKEEKFKAELRKKRYEAMRSSRFIAVLGVAFMAMMGVGVIYLLYIGMGSLVTSASNNWYIVGPVLKYSGLAIITFISLYFLFTKIIIPFMKVSYKYVLKPLGNSLSDLWDRIEFPRISLPKILTKKVTNSVNYLFGWVPLVVYFIRDVLIYIKDFFVMAGDLIYNMYKKNCPRITWEDSNKTKNN
jgi:hypothetical protein